MNLSSVSFRISSALSLVMFFTLSVGANNSATAPASPGGLQVRMSIPWTSLSQLLSKQVQQTSSLSKKYEKEILQIGEFQTLVQQGQVDLEGLKGTFVQITPGLFQVQSETPKIRIQIPKIQIDQEITRLVSGVPLRVRVQATCGPVEIEEEFRKFEARFRVDLSNLNLTGRFEYFQLEPQVEKLVVQSLHCEGPAGLESLVNQSLIQMVSSPDFLSSRAREYFEPVLTSQLNQLLAGLVSGVGIQSGSNLGASRIALFALEQTGEGFTADFNWVFREGLALLPLTGAVAKPEDGFQIQISRQGLEFLIREGLAAQKSETKLLANSISEFSRVLSSRFIQFFIWPDLFNFSKRAEFPLTFQKPTLQKLQILDQKVHLKMQTSGWLQAYREGAWWNYLKLGGRVEGDWALDVSSGILQMTPQNVSLKSQVLFAQSYVTKFDPNMWIASSVVTSVLQAILGNKTVSVALPEFKFGDSTVVRAEAYEMRDQNIFLFLGDNKGN